MKRFLIITISLLISSIQSFSQSCVPGPPITCSGKKVITPTVTQPTNVAIANATCSTLVIKWTGIPSQQYLAKALYQNTVTNNIDTITANNITCDANNNCTATLSVIAGKKYNWSVEAQRTMGTCAFYSYPVTGRLEYAVAACNQAGNTIQFTGRVLLQGAYNTGTGKMNNDLNTAGILQSQASLQPYNNTIVNYAGTERVGSGFFALHPSVVDWVLVELRNPNAPSTVVAQRAAFVQQDGTLVETDGSNTSISFQDVAAGNYFVSIKHRNHLAIRSGAPIDFSTGNGSYDFTTANFKCYKNQTYPSTVQMANVWLMRGGNANGNFVVKYSGPGNAQNQILNMKLGGSLSLILNNVYAPEDVNMNGNVKWSGPGNDQNFLLNGVLTGTLSTVLTEQF